MVAGQRGNQPCQVGVKSTGQHQARYLPGALHVEHVAARHPPSADKQSARRTEATRAAQAGSPDLSFRPLLAAKASKFLQPLGSRLLCLPLAGKHGTWDPAPVPPPITALVTLWILFLICLLDWALSICHLCVSLQEGRA